MTSIPSGRTTPSPLAATARYGHPRWRKSSTWEGWFYLATVIDCHTKACIGYAMADHMRTDLVTAALDMAVANYPLAEDAIFHSDRGTQYTSEAFADQAGKIGLRR